MKKTILWCAVLLVLALVAWRGLHGNRPEAPGEEWQSGRHSFRGHKPQDNATRNLGVRPSEGTYPPRALGLAPQSTPPSDSWLLDADSNWDRFRRLEVVLGGADPSMIEIGYRFKVLHDALAARDFALAAFEMERIARSADIALLKQPGGRPGRGLEYLGKAEWGALSAALASRDQGAAEADFLAVRKICMACHAAKSMAFLNGGKVFKETDGFGAPAPASAP